MTNAEFFVGKAEEVLPGYYADYTKEHPGEHAHADVIVVDPPRKGCEQSVLDHHGSDGAGEDCICELRFCNTGTRCEVSAGERV